MGLGQGTDLHSTRYRIPADPPHQPPPRRGVRVEAWMLASHQELPAHSATSARGSPPTTAPLDPRQLTCQLSHARDLPELLSLQQRHGGDFNGFHIGAFWSRFKRLTTRGTLCQLTHLLASVCQQTERMLPELDARNVANVAHALAKAGLVGRGPWQTVWAALPQAVHRQLGGFDPQGLSSTAWAFASVGHTSPELFNGISREVLGQRLGDFNEQELSNTAWAFAKAAHPSPELFDAISDEAVHRRCRGFKPHELSNTLWAFAKAGHGSAALFDVVSAKALRHGLDAFNTLELSNTAWAFATAGHEAPELFDAISAEVVRRGLGELTGQELSSTAWAFAKAGRPSRELFRAIDEAVRRRPGGLNEQALSVTAWAFATARHVSPGLFEAISAEAARRGLGRFTEQALSNTAWAFANASHLSSELFDAISAEALRRGLGGFDEQDLSNTAWAFATVGHASPELLDATSAEIMSRGLGGFQPQALSNLAWAFAVLDPPSADLLYGSTRFTTRCAQLESGFSCENLRQLHQWSLWREEHGALWPGLPQHLRQACRDAFVREEAQPSQLRSDVVREIRSHGFDVEENYRCRVSAYSIDARVTLNGEKPVAVEVDGPSHFLGRSPQPTGATLLKHRQLGYFGWRLETVRYWEWRRSKELHWLPKSGDPAEQL